MNFSINLLMLIFLIILYFNYQSLLSKKTAIQIINDMGIGYNLGKTFNNFTTQENDNIQYYQIKMWGTELPKRKTINKIKKFGFKTIRFQVIYINSMDKSGKVSSEWISGIKKVIDMVINSNMYCILSIYYEGEYWKRKKIREKYINFWIQVANEFIDYDEHLIFEFMTEFDYEFLYTFNENINEDYYDDYESYHINFLNLTQAFIYTIRNSGGFNTERLLVIPGLTTEIEISLYSFFYDPEIPIDPANKIAVSLNYFFPSEIYQRLVTPMNWYDKYGLYYMTDPIINWGTDNDYKEIMKTFNFLKKNYIDNGVPVIIGQVGIITEKEINLNLFREFLYVIFSISAEINGLMSCLWDISEKIENGTHYYNKEKNIWNDEQIRDNIIKISKGKYVNLYEYYYKTNIESENIFKHGILNIEIGTKKVSKVIINARQVGKLHENFEIGIISCDRNGIYFDLLIKENGKKQYDGTTIFTIDVSNLDCNNYIETIIYWGYENINLNNLTIIFEEKFLYFDYKSYKSAVIKDLNIVN